MKTLFENWNRFVNEGTEATMDEGFLDRMMGRGKKSTLIYIPEQSIQEIDFAEETPTEPHRAEGYVTLFPPRGGSTGSEESIFVGVQLYGDGDSKYEAREKKRTLDQIKKLHSNFMFSDPAQPGGMDSISAEGLASSIRIDFRSKALKQADKQALDKMDADSQRSATDDELGLPRNQGYQTNE